MKRLTTLAAGTSGVLTAIYEDKNMYLDKVDLNTEGASITEFTLYNVAYDAARNVGTAEKVTNGGFDADASWTKNASWTISTGAARHASGAGVGALEQDCSVVANEVYKLVFTLDYTSGTSLIPSVGGVTLTTRAVDGTFTEYFRASDTTALKFTPTDNLVATIDNVSLKKLGDASDIAYGPVNSAMEYNTRSINFDPPLHISKGVLGTVVGSSSTADIYIA